ncbi:sugar transferase [Muricoccus nepalensis]|uniref:sugar transferase n=1 Tax=Muricoccus nepalensis TaxID=1854500 RepID=UPI001386FC15|nr:sugar transferase [Roseomonas nepalensis]
MNRRRGAPRPALALRLEPTGHARPGGGGLPRRRAAGRRAIDVTVSAALLAVTLPLLALAALAVRLDSPGPVLLGEPHLGEGGRVFRLLSFRCTEGAGGAALTRVGGLLRPPRIDQLPVLFNLFLGDMTLVGPAPVPLGAPGGTAGRPGLTGWAALS